MNKRQHRRHLSAQEWLREIDKAIRAAMQLAGIPRVTV